MAMHRLRYYLAARPDGRELYRYRISDAKYAQLRGELQEVLRGTLHGVRHEYAAMFCVFAAEWWRREHERGPWKWEGILSAIHVAGDTYDALSRAVHLGLEVLQRKLLRSNRGTQERLLTLACEGGLPLRRLQVDGAPLATYFREVLEYLEALGMTGEEESAQLAEVAARFDQRLPISLRRDIVHHLVGELVGKAWALRRFVPSANSDPVEHLDREKPDWRDTLPLVVSDASAEALLRGLMSDVATVASGRGTRLRVQTLLRIGKESAQIQRFLDVPTTVAEADLIRALDGSPLPEGTRLQLRLRSESGDTLPCGALSPCGHKEWSFQPRASAEFGGETATGNMTVIVATRLKSIEGTFVEGSAPLGPLPWVFRASTSKLGAWELVGQGSCRRKEPELLVALSPDSQAEGSVEQLEQRAIGRTLVKVSGELRLQTDAGLVRIASGNKTSDTASYELRGPRFEQLASKKTIWKGLPKLIRREGERREEVALEVKSPDGWRPPGAKHLGRVQVRALADDAVVFRDRLQVVPKDLELKMTVGHGTLPGRLTLISEELRQAGVPQDPRWTSSISLKPGVGEIDLEATGVAPSRIQLTLVFTNGMLTGMAPFPQRSLHFESPEGEVIPRESEFHVKRLGGIRAVALSPTPGSSFSVTLTAYGARAAAAPAERNFDLEGLQTGEHILDLRDVQTAVLEMLDATEHLDAEISIKLWQVGGGGRSVSIKAKRYDWTFTRDEKTGDVILNGPDAENLDDVVIEARPFHDVTAVERLGRVWSARYSDARWAFEPKNRSACTWLVTARENGWYRCRPIPFWGQSEQPKLDGLCAAFELPSETQRHSKIAALLDEMVLDWTHPDWEVVEGYLRLLGDLPASTFDLVRVLARHPRAAAIVALRAASWPAALFLRVLDGFEELVFFWEAIPFETWTQTFSTLKAAFPDEHRQVAHKEIESRVTEVAKSFPSVLVPLHHWSQNQGVQVQLAGQPDVPVGLTFQADRAAQLLGWRADEAPAFLRRHTGEETWPAPRRGAELPDFGPASMSQFHDEVHRQRVLNAPVALAQAAAGNLQLTIEQTLFLEEARSFDESYFKQVFLLTFFALVASRQGDAR